MFFNSIVPHNQPPSSAGSYTYCTFLVLNMLFFHSFFRADKGKDQYLFLQLEMVEENLITVLTMDMQTVYSLLPLLESVEMEAFLDMQRGVQR